MIKPEGIGVNDDPHAALERNLVEVGRLTARTQAALVTDPEEHGRIVDALQVALAERARLEMLIAERWLRGLRLAMRIMPQNVATYMPALGSIEKLRDLERRIDLTEDAVLDLREGVPA